MRFIQQDTESSCHIEALHLRWCEVDVCTKGNPTALNVTGVYSG